MTHDAEERRRAISDRLSNEVFSQPDALGRSPRLRALRIATRTPDCSSESGPAWRLYVPADRLAVEIERQGKALTERFPGLEFELSTDEAGVVTLGFLFDDATAEKLHTWHTSDECLRVAPAVLDLIWLPEGERRHRVEARLDLRQYGRYVIGLDSHDDGTYACWPIAVPLVATLAAQLEDSIANEGSSPIEPGRWPNHAEWSALRGGARIVDKQHGELFVVGCGELHLPSGKLVVCDPFVTMTRGRNAFVRTPPGRFPVHVTVADLSAKHDRSILREAYASLILRDDPEVYRRGLALLPASEPSPQLAADEFIAFRVDSGTACFVDDAAVADGMPDESVWRDALFENERPDCWFSLMDSPTHLQSGLANIPLPLSTNGSNLVLFHSGWGDGAYPVIGGYSDNGALVRVHVDFGVIG